MAPKKSNNLTSGTASSPARTSGDPGKSGQLTSSSSVQTNVRPKESSILYTRELPGSLRIGFRVGTNDPYMSFGDDDKKALKAAVQASFESVVPQSFRDAWADLKIPTDSDGYRREADIRDFIRDRLAELNAAASGTTVELEGAATAKPTAVSYVFFNNTRHCVHDYQAELDVGGGSATWTIGHEATDGATTTVSLFAQLMWATPI